MTAATSVHPTLNRPVADFRHRTTQLQRLVVNQAPIKQRRRTLDRHVQNGINPIADLMPSTSKRWNCALPGTLFGGGGSETSDVALPS
jgi:hypothetical protein